MFRKLILGLALLTLTLPACGGRVPSQANAANIAKGYFNKYGKKYPGSAFATSSVNTVEVKSVKEIQKDVANGLLLVKLADGTEVPVIMTYIRKIPLGWRTTSWEWVSQ